MKIILATHLFFPRHMAGTEVLTLELARSLRSKGHDVVIVTCTRHKGTDASNAPWLSKEVYDGFDVFNINFKARENRNAISHHANSPERVAILQKLVSDLSPDLVHFLHINGFSSSAIPTIREMGIPVFFTATDFWAICSRTNLYKPHINSVCEGPKAPADCLACAKPNVPAPIIQALVSLSNDKTAKTSKTLSNVNFLKHRLHDMTEHLNRANGIFVATGFQSDMLTRFGIDHGITKVIPYGVKLGPLPEHVKTPTVFDAGSPLKLVFIGSLVGIKGAHVLLEALGKLSPEKLECLDIRIYGKTPETEEEYGRRLSALAAHLPMVKFAGTFPHEEIGAILRSAHLFVVPSIWYENSPLVLCSAIAAGTPALVSNLGGMTEVIQEDVNGLSFPSGDASALAGILTRLIDDAKWIGDAIARKHANYRTPDDYCNDIEAEYWTAINHVAMAP